MDWRKPNAGALFYTEALGSRGENALRYVKAVKNPPLYGLCTRNFRRDHRPPSWPPGTEYQYAYCSSYRSLLPPIEDKTQGGATACQGVATTTAPPREHPLFKLYETTPHPLVDKHYRGAIYHPDDPMGVQVPEELTKLRENMDGSIRRMSCQEDLQNPYTPNYRYQDWVSRPLTEIVREIEANHTLYCHLPPAPTQYWDFYNEERMGRPAKKSAPEVEYRECRVIPIPAYKDIPDVVPSGATNHYGNHSKYQTSLPAFYVPEASQPCQFKS